MDADNRGVSHEEPVSIEQLGELLGELLRAPHRTSTQVDALLAACARPIPAGESSRRRDELLVALIQDGYLRDLTTSDGRSARYAAILLLWTLRRRLGLLVPPMSRFPPMEQVSPRAPVRFWSTSQGQVLGLLLAGGLCVAGGLVWLRGDPRGLFALGAGVLVLLGTKLLDASKRP